MAEKATQDASIAQYQYMCQKIVGTEEHVKTIRNMNAIRDDLSRNENKTIITSGSFGEGLELRDSDIDIMEVTEVIEVIEDTVVPLITNKTYFTMETDETEPGFTQLRLIHPNKFNTSKLCLEIGCDYYLSNICVKQMCMDEFKTIIHGPCVTDKYGIIDFAIC